MTFGLRNAAQTFQRRLNSVLGGLEFCYAYIDEIYVFSLEEGEHVNHLKTLFKRLKNHNIITNRTKCVFGVPQTDYLGYFVSRRGPKPLDTKVSSILESSEPKIVQNLRRFLGIINFCERFVKNAVETQIYTSESLKKWLELTAEAAFENCNKN